MLAEQHLLGDPHNHLRFVLADRAVERNQSDILPRVLFPSREILDQTLHQLTGLKGCRNVVSAEFDDDRNHHQHDPGHDLVGELDPVPSRFDLARSVRHGAFSSVSTVPPGQKGRQTRLERVGVRTRASNIIMNEDGQ